MKRAAVAIALVCAFGARAGAADGDDYDPHSTAWNGMSTFVGLAEGTGFEVVPVAQLDWSQLGADDILFLVYPLKRVDPSALAAFVQAGGNVVIADDFGEGEDALTALGLLVDVGPPHSKHYWNDRVFAPIATPTTAHPLVANVDAIVANHPAAFRTVNGATTIAAFDDSALVVAGERGTGKFVAIADPSIFINDMLREPFAGNVTFASNLLRWLSRDGSARRIILLRGDVAMFGEPPPFVYDPRGGAVARAVHDIDGWLGANHDWIMTPAAMKGLGAGLAALLLVLAVVALPVRRGPRIDGGWVRFGRPSRRDEPHQLIATADTTPASRGTTGLLVVACVLRDHAQAQLEAALGRAEPLYTVAEPELIAQLARTKGDAAGAALARVYRRLRALPSRSQAAAPWSNGTLARREFDTLYRDVAELCRTLGSDLPLASET